MSRSYSLPCDHDSFMYQWINKYPFSPINLGSLVYDPAQIQYRELETWGVDQWNGMNHVWFQDAMSDQGDVSISKYDLTGYGRGKMSRSTWVNFAQKAVNH
jgi:hypothetical protein